MTDNKAGRIADYIEHIITAITQIEKYAQGLERTSFIESDMAHDAIIRQFEVIGEAARRVISTDPEFTKNHPGLELDAAYRMRNALAHGYETVNLQTVWDTVEEKLPALKAEAISVLRSMAAPSDQALVATAGLAEPALTAERPGHRQQGGADASTRAKAFDAATATEAEKTVELERRMEKFREDRAQRQQEREGRNGGRGRD